ncbi:hypothetical protein D7Y27_00295 [Corallococcus sp. AB004]|uniref:hypothetical protein n=1 Tax=Corallococcus TaxID=83461 RepID=UPI000EA1CDE4|nr:MULTISPECIES: hypothetical protein [Corallococcus]NPD22659.1 hypothetical protein [Corallococcus exiguus]RKI51122.1 hypothetical protein D7Y27_00295 [Corallococcus sp. AB004]RUO94285.1 hypothetical protein D7Y11_05345 [Corallococcus sp. AB018]
MDATKWAVYLGLAWLLTGCAMRTGTVVEGSLQPRHFRFVTVIEQTEPGPGGWREACVHVPLRRDTGEIFKCTLGIGLPIHAKGSEPIPVELAQRISANCANLAAQAVFSATTPVTALGLACEEFRTTFGTALDAAILGSRVRQQCHPATFPFKSGPRKP